MNTLQPEYRQTNAHSTDKYTRITEHIYCAKERMMMTQILCMLPETMPHLRRTWKNNTSNNNENTKGEKHAHTYLSFSFNGIKDEI